MGGACLLVHTGRLLACVLVMYTSAMFNVVQVCYMYFTLHVHVCTCTCISHALSLILHVHVWTCTCVSTCCKCSLVV